MSSHHLGFCLAPPRRPRLPPPQTKISPGTGGMCRGLSLCERNPSVKEYRQAPSTEKNHGGTDGSRTKQHELSHFGSLQGSQFHQRQPSSPRSGNRHPKVRRTVRNLKRLPRQSYLQLSAGVCTGRWRPSCVYFVSTPLCGQNVAG